MRAKQVVEILQPLTGMVLVNIEDCDRQEAMNASLQTIAGWELTKVVQARMETPHHPAKVSDVHLQFSDGGQMPIFTFSLLAREVHSLTIGERTDGNGTERTRAEILFRRGHKVALELV